MEESTLWAVGTVGGLTVLGASAGAAIVLTDTFSPVAFAVTLFLAIFLSCGFAMQLYRRGLDYSVLVGGLAGFLSVFAFFAAPVAVSLAQGVTYELQGLLLLLVVPPLVTGASAAFGTLFLMGGVKRYRAKHGMVHAPEQAPPR